PPPFSLRVPSKTPGTTQQIRCPWPREAQAAMMDRAGPTRLPDRRRLRPMSAIRTALLSAATVLALVPSAGAADDPAAKKVELKKGDKVIFFGDSLTALAV